MGYEKKREMEGKVMRKKENTDINKLGIERREEKEEENNGIVRKKKNTGS